MVFSLFSSKPALSRSTIDKLIKTYETIIFKDYLIQEKKYDSHILGTQNWFWKPKKADTDATLKEIMDTISKHYNVDKYFLDNPLIYLKEFGLLETRKVYLDIIKEKYNLVLQDIINEIEKVYSSEQKTTSYYTASIANINNQLTQYNTAKTTEQARYNAVVASINNQILNLKNAVNAEQAKYDSALSVIEDKLKQIDKRVNKIYDIGILDEDCTFMSKSYTKKRLVEIVLECGISRADVKNMLKADLCGLAQQLIRNRQC